VKGITGVFQKVKRVLDRAAIDDEYRLKREP
jgi:hypothetical protein